MPLPSLPSALHRRFSSVSQRQPACALAPPVTVPRLDVSSGPQPAPLCLCSAIALCPTRGSTAWERCQCQWWLRPARIPIFNHALPLHTFACNYCCSTPLPRCRSLHPPIRRRLLLLLLPRHSPPQAHTAPTRIPAVPPTAHSALSTQHPAPCRRATEPRLRCCWTDCSHGPTK